MYEINSISTNKDIYSSLELDSWANRDIILPQEKFLLDNYMDKNGRTL